MSMITTARLYGNCMFSIRKNWKLFFQRSCIILYYLQQYMSDPASPHSCYHLVLSPFFFFWPFWLISMQWYLIEVLISFLWELMLLNIFHLLIHSGEGDSLRVDQLLKGFGYDIQDVRFDKWGEPVQVNGSGKEVETLNQASLACNFHSWVCYGQGNWDATVDLLALLGCLRPPNCFIL